ncbi:MAG: AarF/ABC1/UbiB kinase family protein [Myxococcota bacterium]
MKRGQLTGVFQSLPRRKFLLDPSEVDLGELERREVIRPHATRWMMFKRALVWVSSLMRYRLARFRDRLRGDQSEELHGVRLREMFERVGGTAIKLGQQISLRVDMMSYEVCRELSRLMDAVEPFPVEYAIERIEAISGKTIDELFEKLDLEPIGSASIACVWRGTLRDGRQVAIKVRRKDVGTQFAADIELISMFTELMEGATFIRPGLLRHVRSEMSDMFYSELDFILEGNFQTIFRRQAKRHGMKWVTAPRIHWDLTAEDVLTSEFIEGVPCIDLIKYREQNDVQTLAQLEMQEIDPKVIGRRILELSVWMRLGSFFFHSDPHPGNMIIRPKNKIVMLDFGACGINTHQQELGEFTMTRAFAEGDVESAAAATLATMSPLPDIDIDRLTARLRQIFWDRYIDINAKDARWWERATATSFLTGIEGTKGFDLPLNIDTLRVMRSTLLYDTVGIRLHPSIRYMKLIRRYAVKLRKRKLRRREIRWDGREEVGRAAFFLETAGMMRTLAKTTRWIENTAEQVPRQFVRTSSKLTYTISTMLRAFMYTMLLVYIGIAGMMIYLRMSGEVSDLVDATNIVVNHPFLIATVGFILLFAVYQIVSKLAEKDHRNTNRRLM